MRIKTASRPRLGRGNNRLEFVPAEEPFPSEAQAAFQKLVTDFSFPCIGAKATWNSGAVSFGFYERLANHTSTKNLAHDLEQFTRRNMQQAATQLATLIAVFRGPFDLDEREFEKLLRSQLQNLHDLDSQRFAWDARVSADLTEPEFLFSFAGQAYYVIGMHGNSSREARRFPWPTLVFNPHEEFERLRTDGNWKRMKQTIRARDYQDSSAAIARW